MSGGGLKNNRRVLHMYVEIQRIAGDIYIRGEKKVFAVDFQPKTPSVHGEFASVDWLIGWAKIGLLSKGHTVPHFEMKHTSDFGNTEPMVGEKS